MGVHHTTEGGIHANWEREATCFLPASRIFCAAEWLPLPELLSAQNDPLQDKQLSWLPRAWWLEVIHS